MFRILLGLLLIFCFFITHIFILQLLILIIVVVLMPYNYISVLPFIFIYDIVFSVNQIPVLTIVTIILIILFYFIKQFIRK